MVSLLPLRIRNKYASTDTWKMTTVDELGRYPTMVQSLQTIQAMMDSDSDSDDTILLNER
jgi:hypothetical protein